ncbi:MAG: family 43 glycosylhydrolase, partial [Eubacterium sp.]|nr:family 43 glycosylhydrolase [Eubacterium sp.]
YNACYDNFEVYDSVLSDSEINEAYHANIPDMPVMRYNFEDGSIKPALSGNAATVYNDRKGGKVLSLDGTNNTFAEIPQGFFDNRDVMTIQFDILPHQIWGNYFTYCFGADNTKYSYFRIRDDGGIRNCVSVNSWQNEKDVRTDNGITYNEWMHIALVYNNTSLKLYVNGEMVSENSNTGIKVSDLGTNLKSYFGKSLYDGDGWYNGLYDNFEVYDRVLSDEEIEKTYIKNVFSAPDLRYNFEDGTNLPDMSGNAAAVWDDEKNSKVLSLDGTTNTFASIPQGYFDGKDKMTVLFDVKAINNSGNYFTFAIGQNNQKYDFFRIRGSEIRNAITVESYGNEHEVKTVADFTDSWMCVALTFDDEKCSMYINGTLAATNNNMLKISELGDNLLAYFGKSFYDGDGYFHGKFDNFEVYNRVLSGDEIKNKAKNNLPLLISVNSGVIVASLDGVSGTDNHTAVSTSINRQNGEITSIVQRRQNIKSCPVKFSFLNDDCKLYIDGEESPARATVDLTADREVRVECAGETETYTLKAAQIANNPVLPGLYADPDIDILDGKYWIYPTTDGVPGWGGTQFHAFSSPDMIHWTDEGVILDNQNKNPGLNDKGVQIASSKWSNGNAWAPAIEEKDGKYYFYYCGRILSQYEAQYGEGMAIGVAYASSPEGPYTASDEPILYPSMMSAAISDFWGQVIDPAIYTENGTSYILFGNGRAFIAELNADMTTVKQNT